jgi:hypothetical protein
MKSIVIIIDYFGKWPPWFSIFLESCRANPTIQWIIHTDCQSSEYQVENVTFCTIKWEDYVAFASKKLSIDFRPSGVYKVNDLKPTFGYLYEDKIIDFDFYGYGDIDVIYGNLRKFFTDDVLTNNVISSHSWCVSGHFALFKNKEVFRHAFRKVKNWKQFLENSKPQRFDEDIFSSAFRYPKRLPYWLRIPYDLIWRKSRPLRRKQYFQEQFSTPLTPSRWRDGSFHHPNAWFWKNGSLTNNKDGAVEFLYLHFMNYTSGRYMNPMYGDKPIWEGIDTLIHFDPQNISRGVRIDDHGFHLLNGD